VSNVSVSRTVRIPKNLDDEIDRIMVEELKTRPRVKRTDVFIMLLNLGISEYWKKR